MAFEFKNHLVETFADYCLKVEPAEGELEKLADDFIDEWHIRFGLGDSMESALGMNREEYSKFIADGRFIREFINSRHSKTALRFKEDLGLES